MKIQKQTDQNLEELRIDQILKAFDSIINDALTFLSPFETAKYRTVVTIDHMNNERYPNLFRECLSYFWSLNLSKNKYGNLVLYFTADKEAINKFGSTIYNRTLRAIFKHTTWVKNQVNIEDCVRVVTDSKDVHNFFYKRFIDGESEYAEVRTVDHCPSENKSA